MTSRRVDIVYFGMILLVALIAYGASQIDFNDSTNQSTTHFEFPEIRPQLALPPVDLPKLALSFRPPSKGQAGSLGPVPMRHASDDVESELIRIRSVLLASSTPTEFAQAD